jgi:hypothetical protein
MNLDQAISPFGTKEKSSSWIKLQNERGTTRTCPNYPAVGSGHSAIHQDSMRTLLQVFGPSHGQQHQLADADQVGIVNYQEKSPQEKAPLPCRWSHPSCAQQQPTSELQIIEKIERR